MYMMLCSSFSYLGVKQKATAELQKVSDSSPIVLRSTGGRVGVNQKATAVLWCAKAVY